MTTAQARFETALAAAQKWRDALPPVAEFCVWPDDVQFVPRAPVPGPAADLLKKRPGTPNAQSTELVQALQGIAQDVELQFLGLRKFFTVFDILRRQRH